MFCTLLGYPKSTVSMFLSSPCLTQWKLSLMSVCASLQIHCENADLLVDAQEKAFSAGYTGPEGHYISRPAIIEVCGPVCSETSKHTHIENAANRGSSEMAKRSFGPACLPLAQCAMYHARVRMCRAMVHFPETLAFASAPAQWPA